MTQAREWPINARDARDRAAEEMQRIVRVLQPLLYGEVRGSETEVIRRMAVALNAANMALRHLEREGAITRPD
jgi:hypothetical protein